MRRRRHFFKFLFPFLFFLFVKQNVGAFNAGFNFIGEKTTTEIPFTLFNNLIIVSVTVNRTVELKFILDTGVRSSILLDNSVSKKLKMELGRKVVFAGPGIGNDVVGNVVTNVSLLLNGVEGIGVGLVVLEKENHLFKKFGKVVHGILGYDIFTRFIVEIDYKARIIRLSEPASFIPDSLAEVLPLTLHDTKPYVETTLTLSNGKKITRNLIIDTGASLNLLLYPEANKMHVITQSATAQPLGRGLGGEIMGKSGNVKAITFNEIELENVLTHFPEEGSFNNVEGWECHGTLGGGILSQFNVVFDYFNFKLYLKKV